MFDFGLGTFELLMIAVVAIIVVGPKDLPKLLRTVGQFMTKVRGMAREFQGYLDDAARETGLDDVKKEVGNMTNFTVTDPATKPSVSETAGSSAVAPSKTAPVEKTEKTTSSAKKAKKPATKKSAAKKPAKKAAVAKAKKTKQNA